MSYLFIHFGAQALAGIHSIQVHSIPLQLHYYTGALLGCMSNWIMYSRVCVWVVWRLQVWSWSWPFIHSFMLRENAFQFGTVMVQNSHGPRAFPLTIVQSVCVCVWIDLTINCHQTDWLTDHGPMWHYCRWCVQYELYYFFLWDQVWTWTIHGPWSTAVQPIHGSTSFIHSRTISYIN